MTKAHTSTLATMFLLVVSGCEKPDLVATIAPLANATVNANDNAEVPVQVIVTNQGKAKTGEFKVSTYFTDPDGNTFVGPFVVPSGTRTTLAPGASHTFNGVMVFSHGNNRSTTVKIKALADSCASDEFMPEYCRVQESNEENNYSEEKEVQLP